MRMSHLALKVFKRPVCSVWVKGSQSGCPKWWHCLHRKARSLHGVSWCSKLQRDEQLSLPFCWKNEAVMYWSHWSHCLAQTYFRLRLIIYFVSFLSSYHHFSRWRWFIAKSWSLMNAMSTVWVKKSPLRTFGNFSKTVGNFSTKLCMSIMRSYLR